METAYGRCGRLDVALLVTILLHSWARAERIESCDRSDPPTGMAERSDRLERY